MTKKEYDHQRHLTNKEAHYQRSRSWRLNNPERYAQLVRKHSLKRLHLLHRLKHRPCQDCGGWFKPWQMDFDHREQRSKVKNVSYFVNCTIKKLMDEIKKCDLVCANCHRDRTHRRLIHAV